MKTIYLIRHGQSKHNAKSNSLSGVTDTPITAKGIEQAKSLRRIFAKLSIEEVFSSPLSRARETAKYIFPEHPIVISKGLVELDYGDYEGFDRSEMTQPDPIIDLWNSTPADMTFPGGAHVASHGKKAFETLGEIALMSKAHVIACVTHRTTTRLIVSQILGLPLNKFRAVPCSNCSITKLSFTEKFKLEALSIPVSLITKT